MPAVLTTVPQVLTALVALGTTTLAAEGVSVHDGPPDPDDLPAEFLSIGHSRDEDEAAVTGALASEVNGTWGETYSVHCILSVATGDAGPGEVAKRRTRCAALWTLFATALIANPTLGVLVAGAVATPGRTDWVYGPSTDGTYAELDFDIDVQAGYLGAAW